MVGSGGPLNPHDAKPGLAARIVGGRVYSKDQSYQSNGVVNTNGDPGDRRRLWSIRIGLRQAIAQFGRRTLVVVERRNGMIRPYSCPASDESGKRRQRLGAPPCQSCHASSPLRPMCSHPAWCASSRLWPKVGAGSTSVSITYQERRGMEISSTDASPCDYKIEETLLR
jgi:hypothetical protein